MKRREFLLGTSAVAIAAVLPAIPEVEASPVTGPAYDHNRGFVFDGQSTYISDIHGFGEGTLIKEPQGWYYPKKRATQMGLSWDKLDSFYDFRSPVPMLNWKNPGVYTLS